jgi:hypothetical protein
MGMKTVIKICVDPRTVGRGTLTQSWASPQSSVVFRTACDIDMDVAFDIAKSDRKECFCEKSDGEKTKESSVKRFSRHQIFYDSLRENVTRNGIQERKAVPN